MICFNRPYHIKYFKGYLSQILLGRFFNTFANLYSLTLSTACKNVVYTLDFLHYTHVVDTSP